AADQCAQRQRKAGDGDFADDRAQDRKVQFQPVNQTPAEFGSREQFQGDDESNETTERNQKVPGDHAAHAEDELGKSRQSLAFEHFLENHLELRDDEDHQDSKNDGGHEYDGAGIKHGGLDFAADFLRLFHELGQPVQNHFQHSAQFAGLDHVHVEAVEHLGMLRQPLGEGAPALDSQGQIRDDLFERGVFFLPLQHTQPAQQGQAGVHQRRQLAGKGRQYFGSDFP